MNLSINPIAFRGTYTTSSKRDEFVLDMSQDDIKKIIEKTRESVKKYGDAASLETATMISECFGKIYIGDITPRSNALHVAIETEEDVDKRIDMIADVLLAKENQGKTSDEIVELIIKKFAPKGLKQRLVPETEDCYSGYVLPKRGFSSMPGDLFGFDATRFVISPEKVKCLDALMENKPVFAPYASQGEKSAKMVFMRNYLVADATDSPQYVGTFGLGPCIGVAIVSKKNNKPEKIGIAHIDAMANLRSLVPAFYQMMTKADDVEITLISSGNQIEKAREILDMLTRGDMGKNVSKVSADLTCSTDFVVNTKTGEISIGIPSSDYNLDKRMPDMAYMFRSDLLKSSHMQ